jgi:hypothetical protein
MAIRFISPSVQFQEIDLSASVSGTSAIGAAFVGPTLKGPAFIPTTIYSTTEYYQKFGSADGTSYMPYAVKSYLTNSGVATIVRILGIGGYIHPNVAHLVMSGSYGQRTVATFHRSITATSSDENDNLSTSTVTHTAGHPHFQLHLEASGSGLFDDYSGSLDSTSSDFIGKLISKGPNTDDVAYAYEFYENAIDDLYTTDPSSSLSLQFTNLDMTDDFSYAYTPWVTSQLVGGKTINLFRFLTRSDGNAVNDEIKIGIDSIKFADEVPGSDYGTFSVVIRNIDDTDRQQSVYETFNNVTLDPTATNYICRVIGDKVKSYVNGKIVKTGDYENLSNYIIVEVSNPVKTKSLSPSLVPWGFKALYQPAVVPAGTYYPTVTFITDQVSSGEYNDKVYYGFDFDFVNNDNDQYLMPVQNTATVGLNVDFNLDNYTINTDAPQDGGLPISQGTLISARKFIIPIYGGFDGMDPATAKNMGSDITATNTMGYNLSSSTSSGSIGYNRAFTLLGNADQYDFNLLITPGVISSLHSYVASRGTDLCETRGDAFYILETSKLTDSVNTAASNTLALNSNYVATYYPWIKILDVDNNVYLWVPPSVIVGGVYSYNDKVGYEWFAPAGLNRGGMNTVIDIYNELTQPERDILYEARVNPIASFPNEGIVVWGQKTLQVKASALDRVNVRRLLISIRKFLANVGRTILFESNTRKTRNNLLNQINPYLEQIQQKQGLYSFKVDLSENVNTQDLIDKNVMKGVLYVQPTRTTEFLQFDINIMPTGLQITE